MTQTEYSSINNVLRELRTVKTDDSSKLVVHNAVNKLQKLLIDHDQKTIVRTLTNRTRNR